MCCLSVVCSELSFQNFPVINLQLLHSVQHLETEFLKKEPVQ
jgi:hypothetical protein